LVAIFSICQCGIKEDLEVKEELSKFPYLTMQKYNLKKKSSKTNQTPSRYHNLSLIPSFNTSQNIIFQKSSYKNRHITWGPKSINKLTYSIMNLNKISLPW
jgi:hypothetical protein